ncbi:hypothetical protein M9H77_30815 [Catharanthus roseus]|uniref:Uncharacterized protein n=1 Tax=Catharanthus roseus TaxID=4058 RepID=A0ACC0A0K5_CATRO|nr:hypothetical protein M9H77_30815 [Catharanthus roseus]
MKKKLNGNLRERGRMVRGSKKRAHRQRLLLRQLLLWLRHILLWLRRLLLQLLFLLGRLFSSSGFYTSWDLPYSSSAPTSTSSTSSSAGMSSTPSPSPSASAPSPVPSFAPSPTPLSEAGEDGQGLRTVETVCPTASADGTVEYEELKANVERLHIETGSPIPIDE